MRVNPSGSTPAYMQVAKQIREAIASDEISDGDMLPSLSEMVRRYGTSVGTIRQALELLRTQGLVATQHGRGTFVRKPIRLRRYGSRRHLRSQREEHLAPLEAEAAAQAMRREQIVRGVTTTEASPEIATLLGLRPGHRVLLRRHLLLLDDAPAQTADSYFPLTQAIENSALAHPAPVPDGVHAELARVLDAKPTHATEDLVARMPTPAETETLQLPSGTPVVDLTRTIHTAAGPVEVTKFVFDASRHIFTYDVPMD